MIEIDRCSDTPMYRQIYLGIRTNILEGTMRPGEKLPGIRDLAHSLGVARNTVEAAYRQLSVEGFATGKRGTGFVIEDLDYDLIKQIKTARKQSACAPNETQAPPDDPLGSPTSNSPLGDSLGCTFDFSYGNRSADILPLDVLRPLANEALTNENAAEFAIYTNTLGLPALRELLARHIAETRDVQCHPDQVVLAPGTQPALRSIIDLFEPGVRVAMEDPGYPHARSVFERCKCDTVPVPVHLGTDRFVECLRKSNADVAFLTPSSQFPLGSILPFNARLKIVAWARENQSYLIEDDHCCEYRYGSNPVPSLQSLDPDHVIYLGTMSKILTPAIRLSYMVLPPALLERWRVTHCGRFCPIPWLSQELLARFMERDDLWTRYTRTTINLYRKRHDVLIDAINRHLGNKVDVLGAGSGLHLLIGDKQNRTQAELVELARRNDVRVYETNRYWAEAGHPMNNYVLVGFSAIPDDLIEEGIRRLATAWYGE